MKSVINQVQCLPQKLFALACLAAIVCAPASAGLLDQWKQSLDPALNLDTRIAKLQTLEEDLRQQALGSPEALRNLARLSWERHSRGDALWYLLRSTQLELSPFRNWESLEQLEAMEASFGIRDGATESLWFWFTYLWSTDFLLLLGALGFWTSVALIAFARKQIRFPFALSPLLLTFVAMLLFAAKYAGSYAVLGGDTEDMPIYRLDATFHAQPIGTLPAGTIVEIQGAKAGFESIVLPVPAWIPSLATRKLPRL